MSPASAVGSDPTRPCPTSRGHGRFFFVSGGAVRAQTAAGPRAGACRLRRFWGTFPQKGIPKGLVPWAGTGRARRSPRGTAGGYWRSREGLQDGLRRRRMKRNVLSGKGAFSSVIRVFPSLADCVPPVPPARLPALPERQTARNALSPVNPPKSGAPTLKRLCPTGANSVERAPPQRPLPQRGKAASPRALPYRMPVSPGITRPRER